MLDRESHADFGAKKRRRLRLGLCLCVAVCIVVPALVTGTVAWIWMDRVALQQPTSPPQAYVSLPDVVRLSKLGMRISGVGNSVTDVSTDGRPVRDEDLACLAKWSGLKFVDFYGPQLTGSVLQYLPTDSHLDSLSVLIPGLDDRSLAYLSNLQSLSALKICGNLHTPKGLEFVPNITDEGLEHLGRIKGLVELWLSGIPVTDTGLANLSGLTDLEHLTLQDTRITDAGLTSLLPMTKLTKLYLVGATITDSGLSTLFKLHNLKVLVLDKTRITGRGIAELVKSKALPNLEYLTLRDTLVTKAELMELRRERPELTIMLIGWLIKGAEESE
jgi:hypothetical protein